MRSAENWSMVLCKEVVMLLWGVVLVGHERRGRCEGMRDGMCCSSWCASACRGWKRFSVMVESVETVGRVGSEI